jgi:hypothetical protein
MQLIMSLMLLQFTSMPELRNQFAKIDPDMMDDMIRGSLIFGIAATVIGGLLILLQRENDKEATPRVTTT